MLVTIATVMFVLVVIGTFLVPGVMMSVRLARGVEARTLTIPEMILSVVPGFHLMIARKILYDSVVLPAVTFSVAVIVFILNFIIQSVLTVPLLNISFVIATWIVMLIAWIVQGYIIQDAAACAECGILVRVVSFIMPPLAEFFVAKNCPLLEIEED